VAVARRATEPFPPFRPVAERSERVKIIEAGRRALLVELRELWRYRELLYFLAWREVKIRYKQTVLGALWAILQPFLSMVVFALFFGRLAGLENRTGGVPYPIYIYAGLLPWTFFASSVVAGSDSLIGNASLVTKVYFPRLLIPLSSVGAALVDLGVSSLLLLVLMGYYGVSLSWQLILLPLFLATTLLIATGVGAFFAALNVSYRDFRYVIPFAVQLWMFVTPVIYPATLVPDGWRWLLAINPMSGAIEAFRAALLSLPIPWAQFGLSAALSVVILLASMACFRAVEQRFADVI
jgi:lipopolysaccharide transport system permease protein